MPFNNFGANPAYIQWKVVRGDTAVLRVEFYDQDEKNPYDTTGWTFICTVHNKRTGQFFDLDVEGGNGFATITATPSVTEQWGSGITNLVAQLDFDLEVTIQENGDTIVWTPVIGIISVIGDITGRDE
jgi:hypothetical protein